MVLGDISNTINNKASTPAHRVRHPRPLQFERHVPRGLPTPPGSVTASTFNTPVESNRLPQLPMTPTSPSDLNNDMRNLGPRERLAGRRPASLTFGPIRGASAPLIPSSRTAGNPRTVSALSFTADTPADTYHTPRTISGRQSPYDRSPPSSSRSSGRMPLEDITAYFNTVHPTRVLREQSPSTPVRRPRHGRRVSHSLPAGGNNANKENVPPRRNLPFRL